MRIALIISLILIASSLSAKSESVFIAQLTSEGARSQHGENIFNGSFPYGPNELTSMGLRQHYLVGYDLATNYGASIGLEKVYSPWQVNIRSTNHNMTLMGAQAELEAIFPPKVRNSLRESQAKVAVPPGNNSIIDEDIKKLGNEIMPFNYQTLPIHALDFDKDTVLMGDWCNKIYEINNKNIINNSEWEAKMEEKYKESLDVFRTFMKKENLTIHEIYPYIDTINVTVFNFDTIDIVGPKKNELFAFGFEYLEKYWSNEESRKIYSNGFFKDLER